jgi:heme exporter protein D
MTGALAHQIPFIIASYAVTLAVIAALIGWVVLDHSAQRRLLGDLEEQGFSRRSQRNQGQC